MKSIPAMSLPSLALLPPSRREIYWSQRREALHAQVHIMEVARLDKKESMVAISLLFEHLPIISLVAIFSIGCKKVYIVHIHVVVLPINIFVERIISFLYTDIFKHLSRYFLPSIPFTPTRGITLLLLCRIS